MLGRIYLFAAFLCALPAVQGSADVVLDQSYNPVADGSFMGLQINENLSAGQTFTVGVSGYLETVGIQVTATADHGDAFMRLHTLGDDGLPDQLLLEEIIFGDLVPPGSVIDPYLVDVSDANLYVEAGEQYVIEFGFNGSQSYLWRWTSENFDPDSQFYDGGEALLNNPLTGQWLALSYQADFGFETYVNFSAVPEPGSSSILLLGGAATLLYRRRHL